MSSESPWVLPGGRIVRSIPPPPPELLGGAVVWSDDLTRPSCSSVVVGMDGVPRLPGWSSEGWPETVGSAENDLAGDPDISANAENSETGGDDDG